MDDDIINPVPPPPPTPVSYPRISTVPDPIRLQGVGSTTMSVSLYNICNTVEPAITAILYSGHL